MFEMLIALASVALMATSQLLFKGAMLRIRAAGGKMGPVRIACHPWIFGGLALNGLAAIGWIFALRQLEISYLFPLLSVNYLLVPIGAWWFFNERVSRQRKLAIAVICIGVGICLFSRPPSPESASESGLGAEPPAVAVAIPAGVR